MYFRSLINNPVFFSGMHLSYLEIVWSPISDLIITPTEARHLCVFFLMPIKSWHFPTWLVGMHTLSRFVCVCFHQSFHVIICLTYLVSLNTCAILPKILVVLYGAFSSLVLFLEACSYLDLLGLQAPSSIRESAELLLGSLFLGKVLETLRTVSWGSHRANSFISHLQAIPVFCSLRQVSRKI